MIQKLATKIKMLANLALNWPSLLSLYEPKKDNNLLVNYD